MTAIDEPSQQLQRELRASVQSALASRRPILHHLNADTSWLLQIPRPQTAVKRGARLYYNILIDPWFTGGQSDVASWFSQQFHATQSAVQDVAELEELAREIEILASGLRLGLGRKTNAGVEEELGREETLIDAVAISHEFTDHCHKDTLLEVHPDVPVFVAGQEAGTLINSWKHFRSVTIVPVFGANGDSDWRSTSVSPLPEWIGISRLLSTDDVLYYHAAIMITFNNRHGNTPSKLAKVHGQRKSGTLKRHHRAIEPDEDDETAEAIVYTPHGVHSGDLKVIPAAQPSISTLAFLHGLHNVRIGTATGQTALQLNLGAHNGLKAQKILKSSYWIGTHDEIKRGGGLVAWFLQREMHTTVKEALDAEREARKSGEKGAAKGELVETLEAFDNTNWADLRNGESQILY